MTAITGTSGADTLVGGAGDNHMVGGSGSDVLVAGSGSNEMIGDNTTSVQNVVGGAGNDAFVITLKSLQAGGSDVIYDFGGAGGWSAGNNDFIAFGGFSAGSTVTNIVDSTKVAGLAYYTLHDAATNADYTIAIESSDGKHLSKATGDFNFYS
jgi:Ca2+-binding RTX toxin-like protein